MSARKELEALFRSTKPELPPSTYHHYGFCGSVETTDSVAARAEWVEREADKRRISILLPILRALVEASEAGSGE